MKKENLIKRRIYIITIIIHGSPSICPGQPKNGFYLLDSRSCVHKFHHPPRCKLNKTMYYTCQHPPKTTVILSPLNLGRLIYDMQHIPGGTHMLRHTGMCRPNGLLFQQTSLDMGPILVNKILTRGSHFTRIAKKL